MAQLNEESDCQTLHVFFLPDTEKDRPWKLSREDFLKQVKEDSKGLLKALETYMDELEQAFVEQNEKVVDLDRKMTTMTTLIERMNEEMTTKNQQIDELITECDEYKKAFAQWALNQQLHEEESSAPEGWMKTTKLPDPPLLTDEKEPKFEDWESWMKNKLNANINHYTTEELKMAYIENQTRGGAAQHLAPRLREEATNKFTTADEMFKHLENVYLNLNHLQTAKNSFQRLIMHQNDNFHEFLTNFLHLAGEAKISEDKYKYELNSKLSFDLQKLVITNFISSSFFTEFLFHCFQAFHTLQNIASVEARIWKPQAADKTKAKSPVGLPVALKDADKAQLMKKGRCFICKKTGHWSFECPRRKSVAEKKLPDQEIMELEETEQEKDKL